jgi:DNA-directed RNA polymerase subunit K/omega
MADEDDFAQDADLEVVSVDEDAIAEEAAKDDPLANLKKKHPECTMDYAETVAPKIPLLASPPLNKDPNHRSPPFLTLYERTKIIGFRANQLSKGARPYIIKPEHVTSVSEIARLELQARRLPFIVRRPMPDGTHEYWRLSDLLIL